MKSRLGFWLIVSAFLLLSAMSGTAKGTEYSEVVKVADLRFPDEWRLIQLDSGWAIYDNAVMPEMIAVRILTMPGRISAGGKLIHHLSLSTILGRLPDGERKDIGGRSISLRRYEVVR